jgi:ribonuclease HI
MTPIILKLEEVVKQCTFKEKQHQQVINLDYDVEHRHWPHPAKVVTIKEAETHEEATMSAYTDGSKYQRGVGSGVVIFKGSDIIARQKLKLEDRCWNNQTEQLAIHKALEEIELLNKKSITPLTAIISTDSRVSLDSLHNPNNHAFLVQEIRKKLASLERSDWRIKFFWVKAHAGTYGNEIADRLAKAAARSEGTKYGFARIPKSTLYQEAEEEARQKWQREWTTSHKAAVTRQYFPTVQDRLRSKIKLTPKMTAALTGHGMTKAYLQRFHLSEEATCSCGNEYQSMDHLLFNCANTSAQREVLIQQIGTWPASKQDLIIKYQKEFSAFVESIDFDALQQSA